jgi:hypothetical protein
VTTAQHMHGALYPRPAYLGGDPLEMADKKKDEARFGVAASDPAYEGKVVTLHRDAEHDGKLYKAGTQDLPVAVADAFIGEGKAFEPGGKKKGR